MSSVPYVSCDSIHCGVTGTRVSFAETMIRAPVMDFDDTLTEADFARPILEPNEERLLASLRSEPDLAVDGLEHSLVSRLLGLFGGKSA